MAQRVFFRLAVRAGDPICRPGARCRRKAALNYGICFHAAGIVPNRHRRLSFGVRYAVGIFRDAKRRRRNPPQGSHGLDQHTGWVKSLEVSRPFRCLILNLPVNKYDLNAVAQQSHVSKHDG